MEAPHRLVKLSYHTSIIDRIINELNKLNIFDSQYQLFYHISRPMVRGAGGIHNEIQIYLMKKAMVMPGVDKHFVAHHILPPHLERPDADGTWLESHVLANGIYSVQGVSDESESNTA